MPAAIGHLNDDCRAWHASTCLTFALSLLAVAASAQAHAAAPHSADEVLLVYNANSAASVTIADHYAKARSVNNILAIQCADSAVSADQETIAIDDYRAQIAQPVTDFLATHAGINFIVLTKGVPIRIDGGDTGSKDFGSDENLHPSVDSYLAAIDYAALPDAVEIAIAGSGAQGFGWLNRYWNATEPFSHTTFGGYLVTRLDGYTEQDAIALIDRALAAEAGIDAHTSVLLDVQPDFGIDDKTVQPLPVTGDIAAESAYGSWNGDLARAGDLLEVSAIPARLDLDEAFVGDQQRLLGYFSWGSNDSFFSDTGYASLAFTPGAIGDTAVSTSARSFLPTTGGQSMIADLVAQGITGAKGYVNEPLLQAIASPSVALDRYFGGFTLAESLYAASRFVGWEDIVLGDPLAAPFAGNAMAFPIQASSFHTSSGVATENCSEGGLDLGNIADGAYTGYTGIDLSAMHSFEARVASPDGGSLIAIHADAPDGPTLGTCTAPPTGDWQRYTDTYCSLTGAGGVHEVYLVYTAGMNVQWFAFRGDASPVVGTLPSPWQEADVGTLAQSGHAIHSNATGNFTTTGAGSGLDGSADAFHYVFQDSDIASVSTRVTTLGGSGAGVEAGLMLRSSSDPASAFAALVATPADGLVLAWRSNSGGAVHHLLSDAAAPVHLRLQRSRDAAGTSIEAAYSADASTWTSLGGAVAIGFAQTLQGGLMVASGDDTILGVATFDSTAISVNPEAIFADGFD